MGLGESVLLEATAGAVVGSVAVPLEASAGAARGSAVVVVVLSCEAMVGCFNVCLCVGMKVEGKAWRAGGQSCIYNESSQVRRVGLRNKNRLAGGPITLVPSWCSEMKEVSPQYVASFGGRTHSKVTRSCAASKADTPPACRHR